MALMVTWQASPERCQPPVPERRETGRTSTGTIIGTSSDSNTEIGELLVRIAAGNQFTVAGILTFDGTDNTKRNLGPKGITSTTNSIGSMNRGDNTVNFVITQPASKDGAPGLGLNRLSPVQATHSPTDLDHCRDAGRRRFVRPASPLLLAMIKSTFFQYGRYKTRRA